MAIIAVLASLLLGAAGRAYQKARAFAGELDDGVYLDEVRSKVAALVLHDPQHPRLTLNELVDRCALSSRCVRYLRSKEVTFYAFAGADPAPQIVLEVVRGSGSRRQVVAYTHQWISTPPAYEGN